MVVESVLDAYRKDVEKETVVECVKLLNGIVQDGEAENEFTLGFDTGLEKGMREICRHFGLDLREVLDD